MIPCREYFKELAARVTDELVITSAGRTTIEWRRASPEREGNLLGVYISGATAVATGLAMARPNRRVISIDGDGSILMNLSILLTIGQMKPSNLIVIIGNNQAYEQTRSIPTFTAGAANLETMARGAGIPNVFTVRTVEEFNSALDRAYQGTGPTFIDMKICGESVAGDGLLIKMDLVENKYRFARYIEQTEGIEILKASGMRMPEPLWPLAK